MFPSIHYAYNKKWHATAMYQWYDQKASNEVQQKQSKSPSEVYLTNRKMHNIAILAGADIL